jgi:hypothetical protein
MRASGLLMGAGTMVEFEKWPSHRFIVDEKRRLRDREDDGGVAGLGGIGIISAFQTTLIASSTERVV